MTDNLLITAVLKGELDRVTTILTTRTVDLQECYESWTITQTVLIFHRNNLELTLSLLKVLIEHGANLDQLSLPHQPARSTLEFALILSCDLDIIKFLILNRSLFRPPEEECRVLKLALKHQHQDQRRPNVVQFLAQLLSEHGVNLSEKDRENNTVLHIAIEYRWDEKILTHLILNGADLKAVNSKGETPQVLATTLRQPLIAAHLESISIKLEQNSLRKMCMFNAQNQSLLPLSGHDRLPTHLREEIRPR